MIRCDVKYHDMEMPRLKIDPRGDWVDVRASLVAQQVERINGEFWEAPFPWGCHDEKDLVMYSAGQFLLIHLGFSMAFPPEFEAHVIPRSSLFKKTGLILVNSMGLIDHTYCGNEDEWLFPAYALRDGHLVRHQRIGQFRLIKRMPPVEFREVPILYGRDRGGWGSTDVERETGDRRQGEGRRGDAGHRPDNTGDRGQETGKRGQSFRPMPGCKRSWIVD